MLKRLFTSNTRTKLLQLFLLNPDEEYFIRELTRRLDEQINSVRRELDNLKKLGLLKSKEKNHKKFFIVNKNFIFFQELKSIVLKAMNSTESMVKSIARFGEIDVMIFSGMFVDKEATIDLLIVGRVDRDALEQYFTVELQTRRAVRYAVMSREDFTYRRKCKDKFLNDLMEDPQNIVAVNKLEKDYQPKGSFAAIMNDEDEDIEEIDENQSALNLADVTEKPEENKPVITPDQAEKIQAPSPEIHPVSEEEVVHDEEDAF